LFDVHFFVFFFFVVTGLVPREGKNKDYYKDLACSKAGNASYF